ncbi:hypothetical protein [Microvirga splendida]|uniref:Uncharacterized protein n=1 Tax=Microvirga splendida TaxID=2795727 RepID=A0ABS0Y1P3_9HYPH|nr:hypothetical protein [Microvirga splendida]MBJ6126211.1 hypothetical protein [Microvirga splendida]
MFIWAAIVALVTGAFAFVGDLSSALVSFVEILGVVALFTVICAAEAFSIPKASTLDGNSVQAES